MIRAALVSGGLLVSACAQQQPVSVLPIQPVDPVVTPVAFSDLRGQSVMVLDRREPEFVTRRIVAYLRACKTGQGEQVVFSPNGFELVDSGGASRLSAMVARRGPVTGVALGGRDFTPGYQEELAQAVEGRSGCA